MSERRSDAMNEWLYYGANDIHKLDYLVAKARRNPNNVLQLSGVWNLGKPIRSNRGRITMRDVAMGKRRIRNPQAWLLDPVTGCYKKVRGRRA